MSSFVYIEFDRTPPTVEIYAPSYTTVDLVNEITIEANENITSDHQEIYVIDSNGIRHDYTFEKGLDNQLVGLIKFAEYPLGIVTIYAKIKDEVDNFSNLVSKSITLKENLTLLKLDIRDSSRLVNIKEYARDVVVRERNKEVI